jgi:RsiW-degrading membrane proteinase PrsW (M82 family)
MTDQPVNQALQTFRLLFGWLQTMPWLLLAVFWWLRATYAQSPAAYTVWSLLQGAALVGYLLSVARPFGSFVLRRATRRRAFEATAYEDPDSPTF